MRRHPQSQALTKAGVAFDFIGFDACLMATAENALMLTKHADYLIASEETEPGVGWYYTNWLTSLGKDPSSLLPRFLARWTKSTWSILLDWANSRVLLLALDTV